MAPSSSSLAAWLDSLPAEAHASRMAPETLRTLTGTNKPLVHVRIQNTKNALIVQVFSHHAQLTLAEMMPVLHSFRLEALREDVFHLASPNQPVWMHVLSCAIPSQPLTPAIQEHLEQTLSACLMKQAETNSLNSLIIHGLTPQALHVLRGLVAYAQQIDARCNPWLMRTVLRHNPAAAQHVWNLFDAKHNPAHNPSVRASKLKALNAHTHDVMTALTDTDHDRMITLLMDMVAATLRTNAWQGLGAALAFKLDCTALPQLPNPRPWREIFVYGANGFEGIHLRGGPLARGGIRHSDRLADYRTEVLALQQTQTRKNTIIVPTGAKGGFVVKLPMPPHKHEAQTLIRTTYAAYINALLSLADNRVGDQTIPPRNVVCHDTPDPYFVVAADKGTATFSDLANETAINARFWDMPRKTPQGFWLADAFASGGSLGYDHKHMGITSRGAWVSVQHHLKALEIEPSAKRPLAMVGIGDMSGDVFGNGLLREPHVHLLGAFNHKHIFLDPTPNAKTSYAERQRLFKARSGWDAYNPKLISAGGGVFERSAKTIPLSPQVQTMLGLSAKQASPDEVIQALLTLQVDVLWNGGIGTYIKATTETHADVADHANNAVRVNGKAIRARVVGEGGNLGISPKGRVEMALHGVKLNTDALDNSAGVSTSDHEVNIKILLELAKQEGTLTEAARVKLLPTLEDAIAALVLADNHLQNMTITLAEHADAADHADMALWQAELARRGIINPISDHLPDAETLKQRPNQRYTRPELAALLAGTKTALRQQIAGQLPYQLPLLQQLLVSYFPAQLQKAYGHLIPQHPLAHQMIDTMVTNMVVNRCGLVMGQRLQTDLGCTPPDAINALLAAIGLLDLIPFWHKFDAEAAHLPIATQTEAAMRWRVGLFTLAGWILAQGQPVDAGAWLESHQTTCRSLITTMARNLPPHTLAETGKWQNQWEAQGLPHPLAERLGHLSASTMIPQTAILASRHNLPVAKVFALFMEIGEELHLPAVVRKLRALPLTDGHTRQALYAMEREIQARQASLTEQLIRANLKPAVWHKACGPACQRYQVLVRDFLKRAHPSLPMAVVLLGRLRELDVR